MVNLYKVSIPKDIDSDVIQILNSGALTSGRYLNEFEQLLKGFINCTTNPVVVNSYNAASTIVWDLVDLKEDDEVIASPMSCLASNQPIAVKKAKIVWADIDPCVGSLDPESVRDNITSKTKAILHYHWGGYPGYIDDILTIGKEYGIPIVEDGLESFGSEYKGLHLGSTGADYSIFSFQTVRLPTSIDGGAVICKDKSKEEKARFLRDYGINRKDFRDNIGEISQECDITIPSYGVMLNELNCFIGIKSLSELQEKLLAQRRNGLILTNELKNKPGIRLIGQNNTLPNYWIFTFLSPDRDELLIKLRENNLFASKIHIRNDIYSLFGRSRKELVGVNDFSNQTISIPSGWWYDASEICQSLFK